MTIGVGPNACTAAVFHYPPPLGDMMVPDFCLTTAPASFGSLPPPRLVPTTFNMLQPKASFTTSSGDSAEVDFNLQAEFPPTPQTEG